MNKQMADKIKGMIDDNMFKAIEQLAEKQNLTTEGWIRKNIWEAIIKQREV